MASTSELVGRLKSTESAFKNGVKTQADRMDAALKKIDSTVTNVDQKMTQLRKMIIEGEEKQVAHENLIAIETKINEQLDSYIKTRRSVLGFIKDFNINLARNSTISELSEELWMSSSRYWLSYAFIAISAWVQNNKELCENAVSEAVRHDSTHSSLFFCLLNLRIGNHTAARSWLYEFFGAVDGIHPPRETALLIQSYIYGVFGRDVQLDNFMQSTMAKWISEINSDKEMTDELVANYGEYIKVLPVSKAEIPSGTLYDHCSNLSELETSYQNASRYRSALKRIKQLENAPVVDGNSDFIARIDKLLEDLVNNYDKEELKLRNEQKFYETIMKHNGDVEAAKKEYAQYMKTFNESNSNIGKQMFRWAVYPEGEDIGVQKYAMQKTKDWYQDAVKNYDREIKNEVPNNFNLSIDLWSDVIDGKDRDAIKQNIHDKFMEARSKEVIFTKRNIILSTLAIVFLIVGCVFSMITNSIGASWFFVGYIVGPVLFAVFVAIVVATTVVRVRTFPKRIEKAKLILDKCLDEIDNYRNVIEKEFAVKDEVLRTLENL
ncbi:MAG: hypothetical protein K2L70_03635 [Clostridia bacterium]|nr:hypothetical protein [Clostridia bacterium]